MRNYVIVATTLLVVFLALFAGVQAAGVPLLSDPSGHLTGAGPVAAAALGVGLLVADVVLPVPSSVVMVAHGALFGAIIGTLLSLSGSVGAALVGFAIGRRGGPLLDRFVPTAERQRVHALLGRWGVVAIVVTRPVPLLAETTAILAGATPALSWPRVGLAAMIGALPAAALYAVAGAAAAGSTSVMPVIALVLALGSMTWVVERTRARRGTRPLTTGDEHVPEPGGRRG